jgi:hypothetical protein
VFVGVDVGSGVHSPVGVLVVVGVGVGLGGVHTPLGVGLAVNVCVHTAHVGVLALASA